MSGARISPGARLAALVLGGLCLLGSGFLLGRMVYAPDAPPPSYLEKLTQALDLRPDQVAALERVLSDEDRDIDAALDRNVSTLQQETEARRSRTEEQMLALLDPAQRQRYDSLVAAGGER
ncbi:MAG TPA: hypothetical protein VFY71_14535 [Planctomycetota bacterium]|nr:hypothetical protein [Planctomycetota bacterium]